MIDTTCCQFWLVKLLLTFMDLHLVQGLDSDMGSPVDLAKSYMQSLPPWQSPYLGSQKFITSPSGGVHIYDDEGKSKYSISSSKVMREILCWIIDVNLAMHTYVQPRFLLQYFYHS